MRILLISLGSRGDCEPFVGIGEMLRKQGMEVVCSFPEQYRNIAEDNGFQFHTLGSEFLNLINSKNGKIVLSGKGLSKLVATVKMGKESLKIQKELLNRQREILEDLKPDIIIRHSKVLGALPYCLIHNSKSILLALQPGIFHELHDIPSIGLDFLPPKLSYKIMRFAITKSAAVSAKQSYKGQITKRQIGKALTEEPAIYGVSTALFPQPKYWDRNKILVAGFWERDKISNYIPDPNLVDFIQSNKKVLLLTFGSMTNSNPIKTSELFIEILEELSIPTIINISGGGLVAPDNYDKKLIFFTPAVPYDWVFPKIYATISHGGAGTVHSSLKSGCATMAIPHIADQPLMNKLIHKSGTGPLGMRIGKLKKKELKATIKDLYTNPVYKQNALRLADQMAKEDFSDELYGFIIK